MFLREARVERKNKQMLVEGGGWEGFDATGMRDQVQERVKSVQLTFAVNLKFSLKDQ